MKSLDGIKKKTAAPRAVQYAIRVALAGQFCFRGREDRCVTLQNVVSVPGFFFFVVVPVIRFSGVDLSASRSCEMVSTLGGTLCNKTVPRREPPLRDLIKQALSSSPRILFLKRLDNEVFYWSTSLGTKAFKNMRPAMSQPCLAFLGFENVCETV